MATSTLKTRIKHKIDSESNWSSSSLIPLEGELIIYKGDKPQIKVGDGSTTVGSLPFIKAGSDTTIAAALTSGTEIGSISIDGATTKLYAPSTIAWGNVTSKPSYYDAKAITSISRSGTTFTATHLDGTTSTFTQQDNNTTYSAGTGLSLSGTTFSNAGVRSISTGSANGTISVNTNGTVTNVAVNGLGSAAYTASTAYLAAGGTAVAAIRLLDNGTHNETASGTTGNAPTTGMLYTSGLYMTRSYTDSAMPTSYGNIINLAGAGTGQLFCGWSGTDNVTGHLYYRSHRDTNTGGWGSWNTILDSNNYSSYTVTKTGSGASGTWGIGISGNAATATALTTSAGSSTVPVYFSGGKPVQCSTTLGVNITGNAATASSVSGWKITEVETDANTILTAGCYRCNTNMTNIPAATYGQLLVIYGGGDTVAQFYFTYSGPNVYVRAGNVVNNTSGSWTAWKRIWVAGDAVTGAVWN